MLPRESRLNSPRDFTRVTRAGNRGAARTVVVHVVSSDDGEPSRVGFVVSKRVGNSVVRHRVVRRLRAVTAARLSGLPGGTSIVVRALPAAADATSGELAADVSTALRRSEGRKRR